MTAIEPGTEASQAEPSGKERRRWPRFDPAKALVHVNHGTQWLHCSVKDESHGGLGIVAVTRPRICVGERVKVVYRGVVRTARICRIEVKRKGRYHIGLEWIDYSAASAPTGNER